MFRKSRLAVLAFIFFFFHAGLVGAYVRCIEAWQSFEDHSATTRYSIQNSNSDDEALHCPDEWNPYRLNQAQHSAKKKSRTDRVKSGALSFIVIGYTKLGSYSAQPFAPPLLCPFLYPSIAIYQSKVVYRI
jgi:hypothetical protein